jgi:EAL domain-containing protein (putative c-di-GMP-specific phosphodiesterase class I)
MYSPRIREDLIPYLYRLRKERGIPMTRLVNEIIEDYLQTQTKTKGDSNVNTLNEHTRLRTGQLRNAG